METPALIPRPERTLTFGEDRGLAHTQVQTTARYAHLAADPIKAAAERVTSNIASILGSGQDQDTDAAVI